MKMQEYLQNTKPELWTSAVVDLLIQCITALLSNIVQIWCDFR